MIVEALIKAAKSWRSMARLVVLLLAEDGGQVQEVEVQLGEARRRWKRVSATLAPIENDVVGARGFDASGALVGSWDAPADDDEDEPESVAESDSDASHRQHTQWVIKEVARIFEGSIRLQGELIREVIEVIRTLRQVPGSAGASAGVSTQAQAPDDETAKTLGMLLSAFMQNQNSKGNNDDEAQRNAGSQSGDTGRQGSQGESGQTSP